MADKTIAEVLIDFALEDKLEHQTVMAQLSAEKLAAVVGRVGKFTIDGEEGGVFLIRLTPYGVIEETEEDDVRNEIWMTDDTFINIIIGELDPRTARARGQVLFSGDRSLYDAHEIIGIFEKWLITKLRPVAKKMMQTIAKGGR